MCLFKKKNKSHLSLFPFIYTSIAKDIETGLFLNRLNLRHKMVADMSSFVLIVEMLIKDT